MKDKQFGERYKNLLRRIPSRYRDFKLIGQGATGTVVRAADTETAETVALKILPPDLAKDEVLAQRMSREALALARLSHPNVVRFVDFGTASGIAYIAVEFVRGRPLEDILADDPPSVADSVEIVAQLAEGLAVAHEAGILHRDIKPTNIMVTAGGVAKLVDFGLAKFPKAKNLSGITSAGQIVGTLRYMAPETLRTNEASKSSDVFQLAVVLYQCLTGVHPLEGSPITVFCADSSALRIANPTERVAGLDPRLDAVVMEAMALDPSRRTPSASALVESLRALQKA